MRKHVMDKYLAAHETLMTVSELHVEAKGRCILRSIDLSIRAREILCLIGPSGAGKSTLLKCLNRLSELDEGIEVRGHVSWRGHPVHQADVNEIRARIGMIFQQPVVFPGSIRHNVLFGVRRLRRIRRREQLVLVETALRHAALWEEVRNRLDDAAATLSVGQQQRLCIARTLACGPEVILMDEPTSALDPRSTEAIEDLLGELKRQHAVVLVTHSLTQAQRVADRVACLCVVNEAGQIMQTGCCDEVFNTPSCCAVEEYVRPERLRGRELRAAVVS